LTKSGKICQAWTDQTPQVHENNIPDKFDNAGLAENYCRNLDGADTIWCYTIDKSTRWEYCEHIYLE
jgi:hypothetical protein